MANALAKHAANEAHLNFNLRTEIQGITEGRTEMGKTGRKREEDERKGENDEQEKST